MITKKEVIDLSNVHSPFCVSIFIPTHRAGEETLRGKDSINLKNQLKHVKPKLEHLGLTKDEIEHLFKPVHSLLEDGEFWRHQSDGLAIFLSKNRFEKYTVPIRFEEYNYVSNEFYIKPLMPLFNEDGSFYLLSLKAECSKLFEGSRYSLTEINIADLIPQRPEDRVGYDHEQKSLQFRTQQGNKGEGIYHGHGEGNAEEKSELLRYYQAIDKGLMKVLHDCQNAPLVVASLEEHFAIYKKANTYSNLFAEPISGNPSDMKPTMLHEKAVEILSPYFSQKKEEKIERFSEALSMGKASAEIDQILPAALEGKVDTLFLENREDVFGTYDQSTGKTHIREVHQSPNVSLMNLAASKVFEQGGKVYLMDNLPYDSSRMNALYRY